MVTLSTGTKKEITYVGHSPSKGMFLLLVYIFMSNKVPISKFSGEEGRSCWCRVGDIGSKKVYVFHFGEDRKKLYTQPQHPS